MIKRPTTMECKSCGATFFLDDADIHVYSKTDCDYDTACPECDSINITKGGYCTMCGKPLKYGHYLCDECRGILDKHMVDIRRAIADRRECEIADKMMETDFLEGLAEYLNVIAGEHDEDVKLQIRQFF